MILRYKKYSSWLIYVLYHIMIIYYILWLIHVIYVDIWYIYVTLTSLMKINKLSVVKNAKEICVYDKKYLCKNRFCFTKLDIRRKQKIILIFYKMILWYKKYSSWLRCYIGLCYVTKQVWCTSQLFILHKVVKYMIIEINDLCIVIFSISVFFQYIHFQTMQINLRKLCSKIFLKNRKILWCYIHHIILKSCHGEGLWREQEVYNISLFCCYLHRIILFNIISIIFQILNLQFFR